MLQREREIEIVGEAANGTDVKQLLKNTKVDVILLDINMPDMNGTDTALFVAEHFPSVKILVLSSFEEDHYIQKMMQTGVAGYILKRVSSAELIVAIKAVAAGNSYFSQPVSDKIRRVFSNNGNGINHTSHNSHTLTDREIEILKLVALGLTNAEIGNRLFISPRTVDTHRRNLMQKLGVHSAVELTHYAYKHKLLE